MCPLSLEKARDRRCFDLDLIDQFMSYYVPQAGRHGSCLLRILLLRTIQNIAIVPYCFYMLRGGERKESFTASIFSGLQLQGSGAVKVGKIEASSSLAAMKNK